MQIFCEKCRAKQVSDERECLKCGAPLGGELYVLLIGLGLVIFLPLLGLLSGRNYQEFLNLKIFFWYMLPAIGATALLYDYHPVRRAIYFWGTAAIVIISLFILVDN